MKKSFDVLKERGYVYQATNEETILITDYWYNITIDLEEDIEIDNTAVTPIIDIDPIEEPVKETKKEVIKEEEPRPPKREILKELFKDRKPKEVEPPKLKQEEPTSVVEEQKKVAKPVPVTEPKRIVEQKPTIIEKKRNSRN